MFALRHIPTGQLLGVELTPNDGDFCVSVEVELSRFEDSVWVVTSRTVAEAARTSTEWYNAGYSTPTHAYSPEELEVVELEIAAASPDIEEG